MRTALLLILAACLLPAASPAQDRPKGSVFGGYSYLNTDMGGYFDRQNLHGWGFDLTANPSRIGGIVIQAAGEYGTVRVMSGTVSASVDVSGYGLFFGPELSGRSSGTRFFFRPLIGLMRVKASNVRAGSGGITVSVPGLDESETDFAWSIGGGVDIPIRGKLSVRVFQLDYIWQNTDPASNHFRFATGLVVNF